MVYQRGQEIFKSEPFTYVVKSEALSTYCDFCLLTKIDKNCSEVMKRCRHSAITQKILNDALFSNIGLLTNKF